jgi:flagellar motor protein MotB
MSHRAFFHLPFALVVAAAAGCASGPAAVPRVAEAERTRSSLEGRDAQTLEPQAFAEADQALRAARDAQRAGDSAAAELHAERAVAIYQHAVALARLVRATEETERAKNELERASEQAERYGAARKAAEREAADLDRQLKIAREAERPAPSGPADPERDRARLVAAQSLAVQARLLCSAARLVSPAAPGLAEAESEAAALEKKLEAAPRPAPIDAAAHARASCLAALTKARRAGPPAEPDQSDLLLGELTRAHSAGGDPAAPRVPVAVPIAEVVSSRDERGVVVTLRSLFHGDTLSPKGQAAIAELGRVAAAHPTFGVQIVLHDATRPSAAETALDAKRGEAIAKTLAGAGATKTKVEQAGARAPIFDPADAKRREKNARVDIVFVGGS